MKIVHRIGQVVVGQKFACKYPMNGTRNILRNQVGEVKHVGVEFIKIQREDGSYRNLRADRMIDPVLA